jgi:hypothetical protein
VTGENSFRVLDVFDRQKPVSYWEKGKIIRTHAHIGEALATHVSVDAEVQWDALTDGQLPEGATHVVIWRTYFEVASHRIYVVDLPNQRVLAYYVWKEDKFVCRADAHKHVMGLPRMLENFTWAINELRAST